MAPESPDSKSSHSSITKQGQWLLEIKWKVIRKCKTISLRRFRNWREPSPSELLDPWDSSDECGCCFCTAGWDVMYRAMKETLQWPVHPGVGRDYSVLSRGLGLQHQMVLRVFNPLPAPLVLLTIPQDKPSRLISIECLILRGFLS